LFTSFKIIDVIGYPIVIKPHNGNQGKGATIGITNFEAAKAALDGAKQYSFYAMV